MKRGTEHLYFEREQAISLDSCSQRTGLQPFNSAIIVEDAQRDVAQLNEETVPCMPKGTMKILLSRSTWETLF